MAVLANKKALLSELGIDEDQPQDLSQPQEAPITRTSENTGISGIMGGGRGEPAPALDQPLLGAEASKGPDYKKAGQFGGRMGPWNPNDPNQTKFAEPWDNMSERYKMMTVLSNFDPRQGVTPDVLKALNDANINGARFSGSGQNLTVDNAGGYDRFGKGGTADIITSFQGGNGTWRPWADPALEGPAGGGAPAGGLDPRLTGDPSAGIQAALASLGNSPTLQALLKQLGMAV